MLKVVRLILVALPIIYAQVPGFGRCPSEVQVEKNFDLQQYLGQWFEYERYPFIFEAGGKCTYAIYDTLSNGSVSVYNVNYNLITNQKSDILGTAEVQAPAKLLVRFSTAPSFIGPSNYWILGTDYKNYAVVYSCTDFFNILNTKVVWILTRDRKPSDAVVAQALQVLDDNKLSRSLLLKTNQDNCPGA